MEKNITKIIDHLITTADLIFFDNSKDFLDEANADICRFCLSQQDDNDNDKTAGGILKEHDLSVWDLKFLEKEGVLFEKTNWEHDAPGSIIDDRTLHVSLKLDSVEKLASINVRKWA
tara:strand:+ start:41 stop:391 length:351 start_codon:yes stop_codon:yes gene_type:complete